MVLPVTSTARQAVAQSPDRFEPIAPHSIEETGLGIGFLSDLVLKVL